MTTLLIILCVLAWLACSVLVYGMTFAYFWNEFPTLRGENRKAELRIRSLEFSACAIIGGPLVLICALISTDFAKHGLRFR